MPINDALMHVGLSHYLILSAILFTLGLLGVLLRRNVIVILMSIELMLNAVNITFVAFSRYSQTGNQDGQAMVFFVMTIAAAEAAVGLALATTIFKKFREVNIRYFEHLKG
jgi:NADH-quinone oxidoreductase subunit K